MEKNKNEKLKEELIKLIEDFFDNNYINVDKKPDKK